MANEDIAKLLMGTGEFVEGDFSMAGAMAGAPAAGGTSYVWLPGVKRRVNRNLRENRRGDFMGRGRSTESTYEEKEFFGSDRAGEQEELLFGVPGPNQTGRVPANTVTNWMYDQKKAREIMAYLTKKGFDYTNWNDAFEIWSAAVKHSSQAFMSSNQKLKVSPWEMLDTMAPTKEEIAKRVPSPWRGLTYDETSTQVDMADLAPETAKQLITKTLTEALGRGPTEQEIKDFTARAAAIIHENPSVQTHTATYEWDPQATPEGGDYRQTGVVNRQAGTSPEDVANMVAGEAQEMADENPEAGAYEAATTGMNAFFQAIMSPVD